MWSRWCLILFATVAGPYLPAARGQEPAQKLKAFELKVVGPAGTPIAGAEIELRSNPSPTAEQIQKGKFVRQQPYGTFATTDAEGVLVLSLPEALAQFDLYITIPGYGPYWAGWSSEGDAVSIPARLTAELEAGWSVGGIIVDDGGKPVADATVRPSVHFKKRPGESRPIGSGGQAKTDAAGRWRFDSVPASLREVFVETNAPGFMPLRRTLTRGEFGVEPSREPVAKIVLDRGLSVTGKVTDELGKPIAGVLVRTKFTNDLREARTGSDGVYQLVGCETRTAKIVVSAPGRATDMKELPLEPAMGPVDFVMKPGGHVRIRVLDHGGKPVAQTRIFFQKWRGRFQYFEFDRINQLADEHGVWIWNEAPLDEFHADICPPEGMQLTDQPFVARAEEYAVRLPAPLVISGQVVDAKTKALVMDFRAVWGIRNEDGHISWVRDESQVRHDGRYQIRPPRTYFAHLVRIEADDYRAAVSRDVKSDEGAVAIDFALAKANGIYAKVITPRNVSAAGARIALGVAGAQINVKNGDIDDQSTYCARATADETGRFHFPAQDKDFVLVITHPSGFAHVKSKADWGSARIIHLEAWSRVEGVFKVGRAPTANVPLYLNVAGHDSYGDDVPHIFTTHETTTGPGGRFVFDRVYPGRGWLGRRIMMMVDDGATEITSSCMVPATFPAGETISINLGGSGRVVVGKLQPPDGFAGKVAWNFAQVGAASQEHPAHGSGARIDATVGKDGSFRIDDAPAGDYSLRVLFTNNQRLFLVNHQFTVPAPAGDLAAKPIDLGVLKLEKR